MISIVDKAVFTCLITAGQLSEGGSAESCDGGIKMASYTTENGHFPLQCPC